MKNLSYINLLWPVFSMFGILFCNPSIAQPPDLSGIMTERMPDCSDITFNSMKLIPEYYNRQEVDSAIMVLDYWIYHCGMSQDSYAAQVLLDMYRDSVPIDDRFLAGYFGWSWSTQYYGQQYSFMTYRQPARMLDRIQVYSDFLKSLAASQAARQDLPAFEHLLALYFSGQPDSLLSAYRREEFPDRPSQGDYLTRLASTRSMVEFHYGMFAGAWPPRNTDLSKATRPIQPTRFSASPSAATLGIEC